MTPTPTPQVRFGMSYLLVVLGAISLAFALVAPTKLNTPNTYITICVAAVVLASAWLGQHAIVGLVAWTGSVSTTSAAGMLTGALAGAMVARRVGIQAQYLASATIVGGLLGLVLALSVFAVSRRLIQPAGKDHRIPAPVRRASKPVED